MGRPVEISSARFTKPGHWIRVEWFVHGGENAAMSDIGSYDTRDNRHRLDNLNP